MTRRIAVLASGRGSNFQAVIDAIAAGRIPAACAALITDNPKAYAIERARMASIPVVVLDYASFPSKKEYEDALLSAMQEQEADGQDPPAHHAPVRRNVEIGDDLRSFRQDM